MISRILRSPSPGRRCGADEERSGYKRLRDPHAVHLSRVSQAISSSDIENFATARLAKPAPNRELNGHLFNLVCYCLLIRLLFMWEPLAEMV